MNAAGRADFLIVSPAQTGGWRANEEELVASLEGLGASCRVSRVQLGPSRHLQRAYPLVDAVEAAAARRALRRGLAEGSPLSLILLSSTAALLAPIGPLRRSGLTVAVRVDSPAATIRPGLQNLAQRRLEHRRLREADLVIAMGPRSVDSVRPMARRVAAVPVPVEPATAPSPRAEPPLAITYAANPKGKGLDMVCRAFLRARAARPDARLAVTGIDPARARRFLSSRGIGDLGGVELSGILPRQRYLALLREAAVYVSASRSEGYGIAQLEALAAGVPLATTPSRGAYEAEPLAGELAPELVTDRRRVEPLASAIAAALAMSATQRAEYQAAAAVLLAPFSRQTALSALRDGVLPVLLPRPGK
jgi:glycosyltransferase involved in cell wall biosynthesis